MLALLALCWSAAELLGVQKVLMTQSLDDHHSYTQAAADPAQHGKVLFWDLSVSERGTLPRDTQCWETWEQCSAVSNASFWCVFFTQAGLNQSPDLGWGKSISTEVPTPVSASYSFVLFCSMVRSPFPRTVCSKSCPVYPPILSGQITVISITNLRSPTQFHLQMPMSHSEPPPTSNRLCH